MVSIIHIYITDIRIYLAGTVIAALILSVKYRRTSTFLVL